MHLRSGPLARPAGLPALATFAALVLALTTISAGAVPAKPPSGAPAAAVLRPVAVFGADERTSLPRSLAAVAAKIGVIHDPRSHSVCTAFCVAPGIVATAAHCLFRTSAETPLRLADFTVRLHGARATSRLAGAAEGAPEPNVLAGAVRLHTRPPIDATRDWALVRLAKPLCAGSLKLSRRSVEEVMRLADAGRVYNIAYHRDLPQWQPALARRCHVARKFKDADWSTIRRDFAEPERLLLHTCDTGGASSGSPLLVDGPDGPEVVGINVGTYVQSKVVMLNGEVVHRFKADDVANTGVSALSLAGPLAAFAAADTLAARDDVLSLQRALAARGLYKGPHDGRYGAATRAAVESFERASAMPVTGLATRRLLLALTGASDVVTGEVPARRRR